MKSANEKPLSNREINSMFGYIKEKLEDHTFVHTQILEQTTQTNGKVAAIQRWREQMSGAIKVMVFIVPTVFGIMGWMAYEVTHLDDKVQEALIIYEIP